MHSNYLSSYDSARRNVLNEHDSSTLNVQWQLLQRLQCDVWRVISAQPCSSRKQDRGCPGEVQRGCVCPSSQHHPEDHKMPFLPNHLDSNSNIKAKRYLKIVKQALCVEMARHHIHVHAGTQARAHTSAHRCSKYMATL